MYDPVTTNSTVVPFCSFIIPSYNEAPQIHTTLDQIKTYMDARKYDWEIIVVNDGSEDSTEKIVKSFCPSDPRIQILTIAHSGKGWAVKTGMMQAKGTLRFMCDADLSMPINQIEYFFTHIADGFDIVVGSRQLAESKRFNEPKMRHIIGRIFNIIARKVSLTDFNDTQCGFKCFKDNVAEYVFRKQLSKGFAFDIEILKLAKKANFKMIEIPIIWHHKKPSKVKVYRDSIKMITDTLLIAFRNTK